MRQVLRELRSEARGITPEETTTWDSYLRAQETAHEGNESNLTELALARSEGYEADPRTLYAWQRLEDRAAQKDQALTTKLETIAERQGITLTQARERFNELYDEVPIRRGSEVPEEFTPQAVREYRQAGLPYDKQTVTALERLQNTEPTLQPRITRQRLAEGSFIQEGGYDPEGGRLELVLSSRPEAVYAYRGVPETVWDEIRGSSSPGRAFNAHIRNNPLYRYEDAEESDLDAYRVRCEDCGQFVSRINPHTCQSRTVEEGGSQNRIDTPTDSPATTESEEDASRAAMIEAVEAQLTDVSESLTTYELPRDLGFPRVMNVESGEGHLERLNDSFINANYGREDFDPTIHTIQGYLRANDIDPSNVRQIVYGSTSYAANAGINVLGVVRNDEEFVAPEGYGEHLIPAHIRRRPRTARSEWEEQNADDNMDPATVHELLRSHEEEQFQTALTNGEIAQIRSTTNPTRIDHPVDSRIPVRFAVSWGRVRELRRAFQQGQAVSADINWAFSNNAVRRQRVDTMDYDDYGNANPFQRTSLYQGWYQNSDGNVTGRLTVRRNDDGTMETIHSEHSLRCDCPEYRRYYRCNHVNFVLSHGARYAQQVYLGTDNVRESHLAATPGEQGRGAASVNRRRVVETGLGRLPETFVNDHRVNIREDEDGVSRVYVNPSRRGAPTFQNARLGLGVEEREYDGRGTFQDTVGRIEDLALNNAVVRRNNMPPATITNQALRYGETVIPCDYSMDLNASGAILNEERIPLEAIEESLGSNTVMMTRIRENRSRFDLVVHEEIRRLARGSVTGRVTLAREGDDVVVRNRSLRCDCEQYRRHYSCVHTRLHQRVNSMNGWVDNITEADQLALDRQFEVRTAASEAFSEGVDARERLRALLSTVHNTVDEEELREHETEFFRSVANRVNDLHEAGRRSARLHARRAGIHATPTPTEEQYAARRELHKARRDEQDPGYTDNPQKFYNDFQEALRNRRNNNDPIEFRTENVTDGICADEPGARAFGVELEFTIRSGVNRDTALANIGRELAEAGLTRSQGMRGYHSALRDGYSAWSLERDATVDGELVSPILRDTPEDWEQLRTAVEIIKRNGGEASTRAGSHVNISSGSYGSSAAKHVELMRLARQHEDTLYRMASDPSRGTHRGTQWCPPNVVTRHLQGVEVSASDTNLMSAGVRNNRGAINCMNSGSNSNSSRIEFRLWDSTLDPAVIQQQVAISAAMVEYADRRVDIIDSSRPRRVNRIGQAINSGVADTSVRKEDKTVEQVWNEAEPAAKFFDLIFRRDEDRKNAASLFAITNWVRR